MPINCPLVHCTNWGLVGGPLFTFCGLHFSSLLIHPFAVANGCKNMLIKILGGDPPRWPFALS